MIEVRPIGNGGDCDLGGVDEKYLVEASGGEGCRTYQSKIDVSTSFMV